MGEERSILEIIFMAAFVILPILYFVLTIFRKREPQEENMEGNLVEEDHQDMVDSFRFATSQAMIHDDGIIGANDIIDLRAFPDNHFVSMFDKEDIEEMQKVIEEYEDDPDSFLDVEDFFDDLLDDEREEQGDPPKGPLPC